MLMRKSRTIIIPQKEKGNDLTKNIERSKAVHKSLAQEMTRSFAVRLNIRE